MSLVTYDGICFPYPMTTKFSQEAILDDTSNTDWCCTRFDISVQCLLNAEYTDYLYQQLQDKSQIQNAADVMKVIRVRLMQPRRELSFKCNGRELLPVRAGVTAWTDARNGPIPQSCSIQQMTADTFIMSYSIQANYWEKYSATASQRNNPNINQNLPSSVVLSNRWQETVEIDNCLVSRRTREGKYMIRSDNNLSYIADMIRSGFAVVSIPEGFLRENTKYVQSPDGLSLQYTIMDREYFKLPPDPAYEAKGSYTETIAKNGAVRYGDVRLTLKGSINTQQDKLVEIGLFIMNEKLRMGGAVAGGRGLDEGVPDQLRFGLLKSAYVEVDLYENRVSMSAQVMLSGLRRRIKEFPAFMGSLTFTPFSDLYDDNKGPVMYDRGTAGLLLQAAAYYDPNLIDNGLGPNRTPPPTNEVTPRGDTKVQTKNGKIPGQR